MKRKINCSVIVPVSNEKIFKVLQRSLRQKFDDFELIPVRKAKSMFNAWREGLKKAKKDVIMFSHQDCEYYDMVDFEKELGGGYGMLGVAGTREIVSKEPYWFNQSRLWQGKLSGQVFQRVNGVERLMKFGAYGDVVALDGVCVVTSKQCLAKIGGVPRIRWAKWDFYDQILSLKMRKNFKIKTVPIQLAHSSAGYRAGGNQEIEKKYQSWAWKGLRLSSNEKISLGEGVVVPLVDD